VASGKMRMAKAIVGIQIPPHALEVQKEIAYIK
jgi:hypothetical protein